MNNLLLALEITVLGMGLVFGAILLLWWMMALLTNVAARNELPVSASAPSIQSASLPANRRGENELRIQAAAIAVTMALAERQTAQAHPRSLAPTAIVSAWQLGMRTRQMYQKGFPIVRNPRKIG